MLLATDVTELHQLFKLPILFQHYAEHKERNTRVSFVDFLSMHYWGDDMDDNDDDRDMQLPFKKIDAHITQTIFLPAVKLLNVKAPELPVVTAYPDYTHQYCPDRALASPFRPPCA
ncbi:hypothetical protein LT679_08655 [Mucilaginibacter roseus]|uniref:Uncharacterized protein n=1 Tax=Mucilaginibacter roseus TaxID=1528868 RepID=A0ABS8U325_9SPHI|nr:hypothetical protein [Mucilaginibacter roseus]MCD8740667.1 hypothetical protein [Mucilaginibacter roseus]